MSRWLCLYLRQGYKPQSTLQDIFTLTQRAIREDEEDVAKQAIEFWCTIAEEEADLQQVIQGDTYKHSPAHM